MDYILSLGSNLGNRMNNLRRARRAVACVRIPGSMLACAPVYATEPVDVPARFNHLQFLNTVVRIASALQPRELLRYLHDIELSLGRKRHAMRYGPRIIDIDIITVGDIEMDTPNLILPHPHAAVRRFVLQPLAHLLPDMVLPGQRLPVRALLAGLPISPRVTLHAIEW